MHKFIVWVFLGLYLAAAPAIAADRSEDLAAFRTQFFEKDKSYSATARAEADALLRSLEQEADALSDAAYELKLAEIVAKADNGHTLFFSGLWRLKFNRIPIKIVIFENRLYIAGADELHSNLVEVTHVNGTIWPDVRRELGRYQGGLDQWKAEFLRFFLESPQIMHASGLSDSADALSLSGVRADGAPFEATIKGQRLPADYEDFSLYIPPSRLIELVENDKETPIDEWPLFLRGHADLYRFEWLRDGIAYIQFKGNAGESRGINASRFSENVIAELQKHSPRNVILDQRFNSGGDLNTTRDLMQALPTLTAADGKIYVVTSGKTFSAGISSIGYLKQAGGDRVIIVGEPVGDRLEFWAEGPVVELTQSRAAILYATERHNYMTGCPEDDCHGSIKRNPIRVKSLAPEYLTPMTYEDFLAGRDPAMDKIMSLIAAADWRASF